MIALVQGLPPIGILFVKRAIPGLFFFIYDFLTDNSKLMFCIKFYRCLDLNGSTNWATTTARLGTLFIRYLEPTFTNEHFLPCIWCIDIVVYT